MAFLHHKAWGCLLHSNNRQNTNPMESLKIWLNYTPVSTDGYVQVCCWPIAAVETAWHGGMSMSCLLNLLPESLL